jgi:hypothetical protein
MLLDSVATSGQIVLPVNSRHIICCAHGLTTLQGTTQNGSIMSAKDDIAVKYV